MLTPEVPPVDIGSADRHIWSYHGRFRAEGLRTDGRPVFDAIAEATGQRQTARIKGVEYRRGCEWTELAHHFRAAPRGGARMRGRLPASIGVQINW